LDKGKRTPPGISLKKGQIMWGKKKCPNQKKSFPRVGFPQKPQMAPSPGPKIEIKKLVKNPR